MNFFPAWPYAMTTYAMPTKERTKLGQWNFQPEWDFFIFVTKIGKK